MFEGVDKLLHLMAVSARSAKEVFALDHNKALTDFREHYSKKTDPFYDSMLCPKRAKIPDVRMP